MKTASTARTGFAAAVAGVAAVFLVVAAGSWIGWLIETRIKTPVVSYEMAPFVVWLFATPGGALMAILGAFSERWWHGLIIGLVGHGLCFGCLLAFGATSPFAVSCWAFAVGTLAGGAAGAMGGLVRQSRSAT